MTGQLAGSLTWVTGTLTQGQIIRQGKRDLCHKLAAGSPPVNLLEKLDSAELPWMATGVFGPVHVMLANTIPVDGPAGSGTEQQVGRAGTASEEAI